jgi:AhpD family alkylhydroperoxidase
MDERTKELVAVGASAAANCQPCLEHHLAQCDALAVPRREVRAAVEVGLRVNHGAEQAIRKHAHKLLGAALAA